MRRTFLLATLLAALTLGSGLAGCGGTGTGDGLGAVAGAVEVALALPGGGETVVLGLKNLAGDPAPVTATVFTSAGGAGTVIPLIVPAKGGLEIGVAAPPVNGWIHVETRDPATLALLPTSGFVVAYLQRQGAGPRAEYAFGLPFATVEAAMPHGPDTTVVQVINKSRLAAAPTVPATLDVIVTVFNTAGAIFSATPVTLAVNEAFVVPAIPLGTAGQVKVAIAADDAAKLEAFTMATREDPAGLGLAVGFGLDRRIAVQTSATLGFTELALQYGRTPDDDFRDFVILATNATDGALSVQFDDIRDATGGQIMVTPRTFTLGARETRYFATTLAATIGLQPGETHPFADLFGDVFAHAGLVTLRMALIHAPGLVITAPNFDPAFFQAYQEVPEARLSISSMIVGMEQETTTLGAERNWVTFTNPTSAQAQVFVRAFTPGGAEYLLPDLFVPPEGRFDWSPDAIVLNGFLGIREDQNVGTDPPVPFLSLHFSSSTGLGIFGRREVSGPDGILLIVTPHVVEPLDD